MKFLLDTCVVSELAKPRPDPRVVEWIDSVEDERLFLSVVTVGEFQAGVEKLSDARRKAAIQSWLDDDLLPRFKDNLLPVDAGVMRVWGRLTARLEKHGRPMPAMDALLAAAALHADASLATRNVEDFKNTGVDLLNPWDVR